VCGTVLGDGCLQAKSAHLTIGHSERQADYAQFKADLLAELEPRVDAMSVAAVAGGEKTCGVVHVRTLAHRALGVLRREFYAPEKVVPAWIADQLNARMLAVWFMDDGYTRIRSGGRRPLSEIATVGFSDADLQILLRDPDVEARVPFDPSRLERGPKRVLYEDIDVEDITDRERHDTTFFCLDVEGTHNFVTSGGVVHNCRPPGNRDPHPEEIATCEPYLRRQVELIQPRVICTLGNFATKLLRGDPAGITRVHGQPETRTFGSHAVRLYPIFHPAAALYTPSMLETLRVDFARLPELLALAPPPAPAPPPAVEEIEPVPEPEDPPEPDTGAPEPVAAPQLGLF